MPPHTIIIVILLAVVDVLLFMVMWLICGKEER